jgi:antitoxin VapB
MGQLNLKDAVLVEEAKALAALFGSSTTEAVRRAVHDRLEAEQAAGEARKREKYERLMAFARESAKHAYPGATSDHSDMYDENGLPK